MPSIALPAAATALARRQHGTISGSQLLAAGLTRTQIRYRLEHGLLEPRVGDTYSIGGSPSSTLADYRAATLAVDGSVLSGRSAAHLLGLPGSGAPVRPPEVTIGWPGGHEVGGVRIRRCLDLLDRHRSVEQGIPVTTIPRTVLDLAADLDRRQLARLVDDLVTDRRLRIDVLFDEFDRVARRGRAGTTAMRGVLATRLGSAIVEASELERRALQFLQRYAFPTPVTEFRPPWAGHAVARVDLAWVEAKLIVELDGRRWHDRDDRFEHDRLRDQIAMSHGWAVLRVTWRQLTEEPEQLARRLRRTLDARLAA